MNKKPFEQLAGFIRKYHLEAFKDVAIFIIILLVFHVAWKIFVTNILAVGFIASSAQWLAGVVFETSKWVLQTLHVNVVPFDELTVAGIFHYNVFYHPENNGYVYVNMSCSGLKQFYQWFFLMILYPGPWRHKFWFIPLGLVVIHFVNVLRIVGMVFVTIHNPANWHFIHDYIARPFFYVVMFFLWVWWNERFYLKSKKTQKAE